MRVCSFFAERNQGFSGKKYDPPDTCAIVYEILQSWKLKKIEDILAELFFFKLLSFLNDLSYRCQIGLKWKVFWCSFWLKLDWHSYFRSWMHSVNWTSILQKNFPEKNWNIHAWHDNSLKLSLSLFSSLNFIKISFIWDQSGIRSSNRLRIRAF